jgi:hypothetical protein
MRIISISVFFGAAFGLALSLQTGAARAAGTPALSQCVARYKAAKAAGRLPAGEGWPKFYAGCAGRARAPAPTAAAAAAPAKARAKRPMSPAYAAFIQRARHCGKLWRADKAAGKTAGESWPKYLSACNARLKAKGS